MAGCAWYWDLGSCSVGVLIGDYCRWGHNMGGQGSVGTFSCFDLCSIKIWVACDSNMIDCIIVHTGLIVRFLWFGYILITNFDALIIIYS